LQSVRSELLRVPGVCEIHDFHIWQLNAEKIIGVNVLDFVLFAPRRLHSCAGSMHATMARGVDFMAVCLRSSCVVRLVPGGVLAGHSAQVCDQLKLIMHRHGVHSTTVQPEFVDKASVLAAEWLVVLCIRPACSRSTKQVLPVQPILVTSPFVKTRSATSPVAATLSCRSSSRHCWPCVLTFILLQPIVAVLEPSGPVWHQ
jgi:hypothetical protein